MTKDQIPNVNIDGAKWAKGVFTCPHCNHTIEPCFNIYKHIVGLSELTYGKMKVVECPQCFERYFSHVSDADIQLTVMFSDENEHLKNIN